MDPPPSQSQVPGAPTPGHRDIMFCHECNEEWYRDQHGLTCPECHSDFTEIIEDNNDPRDNGHDDDDDNDLMSDPDPAPPPHHFLHNHNPWHQGDDNDHDDPEEGDISNVQWRQLGPGSFAVSMNRTISSPMMGGAGAATAIGGFAGLLNQIIGGGLQQAQQQNQRHQDNHDNHDNQDGQVGPDGPDGPDAGVGSRSASHVATGSGVTPGGHRFTYSSTARLIPRDTDRPANLQPVDELNNVLVGIMAAFGETPAHHHQHNQEDHPLSPFMGLFAHLMPGNGQAGDFVYSQEALDRIVTQLMEQSPTSTAPGPAPQSEIEALPRKPVTVDMLGPEGRAECSICMDEVNIGEQVTELPCHHWFHHQCVAAWLSEHDTCPHCRKGISGSSSHENPQASGGASGAGADATRPVPGAFATGEGSASDPFVVHDSPPANVQGRTDSPGGPGSADESGGGGFGDRIRRGFFGPPR